MEELVTVDEVGEDDDSIIEPDLPELEKFVSCPKGATEGEAAEAKEEEEEELPPPRPCVDAQKTPAETSVQDRLSSEVGDPAEAAGTVEPEAVVSAGSPEDPSLQRPQRPAAPEPALADVPPEEQTCSEDKDTSDEPPEESPEHHTSVSEEPEPVEAGPVAETVKMEVQARRGGLNRGITELLQTRGRILLSMLIIVWLSFTEPEVPSPCLGQEKAAIEHSIPLGKPDNLKITAADELWCSQCCHVAPSLYLPLIVTEFSDSRLGPKDKT